MGTIRWQPYIVSSSTREYDWKFKNLKTSPRLCPIFKPDLEGQVQNEYAV